MQQLTIKQRQYLKGLAHPLQPVVTIGNNGLTPAVIKEIDISLKAHELIKVKVTADDRKLRASLIEQIAKATNAFFVQHIGKLIIFYRTSEKPKISLPKE